MLSPSTPFCFQDCPSPTREAQALTYCYVPTHVVPRFWELPERMNFAQAAVAEHFPDVTLCAKYVSYRYGHLERRISVKHRPQDDVLQYQMNVMTAASQLSVYPEAIKKLVLALQNCDRRIIFLSKLEVKQPTHICSLCI